MILLTMFIRPLWLKKNFIFLIVLLATCLVSKNITVSFMLTLTSVVVALVLIGTPTPWKLLVKVQKALLSPWISIVSMSLIVVHN